MHSKRIVFGDGFRRSESVDRGAVARVDGARYDWPQILAPNEWRPVIGAKPMAPKTLGAKALGARSMISKCSAFECYGLRARDNGSRYGQHGLDTQHTYVELGR
eukprot:4374961-Pleurochrysis_carterae.AAC.1